MCTVVIMEVTDRNSAEMSRSDGKMRMNLFCNVNIFWAGEWERCDDNLIMSQNIQKNQKKEINQRKNNNTRVLKRSREKAGN